MGRWSIRVNEQGNSVAQVLVDGKDGQRHLWTTTQREGEERWEFLARIIEAVGMLERGEYPKP